MERSSTPTSDIESAAAPRTPILPWQAMFALSTASTAGVVAVLPALRDAHGLSDSQVGLVAAAGFVAAFLSQVLLAPRADRFGSRRMIVVGLLTTIVGLLAMAVGGSFVQLVLARIAIGLGAGMTAPSIRSAVASLDPRRVGANQGRLVLGELGGFLIGPMLTGIVTEVAGLDVAFAAMAAGVAIMLPIARRLPAPVPLGDQEIGAKSPWRQLFSTRSYLAVVVMIGGYSLGFGAFEAIVPLQLADHGHGSVGIALVVVCLILPIGAASLIGGHIADRFGAGRVAFIGLFAGSVLSTLLGTLTTLPSLIAVLVAVGIADGFGFTAALSMAAAALPAHRTAALAGVGAAEMLCAGTAAALGARLYTSLDASTTWVVLGITMTCSVAVGGSLMPRQTTAATVDQPEGVFT